MILASFKNINLSEYARKAEHVLILKVASVAPFNNNGVNGVFAVNKIIGDVNLACAMADLTVCGKSSVYEKIKTRGNTLKIYVIFLIFFF